MLRSSSVKFKSGVNSNYIIGDNLNMNLSTDPRTNSGRFLRAVHVPYFLGPTLSALRGDLSHRAVGTLAFPSMPEFPRSTPHTFRVEPEGGVGGLTHRTSVPPFLQLAPRALTLRRSVRRGTRYRNDFRSLYRAAPAGVAEPLCCVRLP